MQQHFQRNHSCGTLKTVLKNPAITRFITGKGRPHEEDIFQQPLYHTSSALIIKTTSRTGGLIRPYKGLLPVVAL